ncbi:MAG: thioesterase family protein [Chrysiogenia bacterium]
MTDYIFKLDLKVRDYECDMQGIVNNAIYQNYLEHCRHEFLLSVGIDFNRLTQEKIFLVVVRAELDYKIPLRSGDVFWIGLNLKRVSPIRFVFLQDIFHYPDQRLVLSARTTGTALNEKGHPFLPPEIIALLEAPGKA